MKRIFAALVLLPLLLTVPLGALNAAALTPTYQMSEAYLESPYYRALTDYTLTGDMRRDVVSVALTQLGYHEGDGDTDMDGTNIFGSRNYVEYNRIYGQLDNGEGNGVSYGYAWCASYVSWCLRQAGVPDTLAPNEVSCSRMTRWFESHSVYYARSTGYTPLPGDIVMFQNGDNVANHVGFVVGVQNGILYTVEGNSGNVVGMHSYALTDDYILGYCVPAYTVTAGASYDFPLEEGVFSPGEYIVTSDGLQIRSTPNASGAVAGVLSKGDTVYITHREDDWGQIDHKGITGWVSLPYVYSLSHPVCIIRYHANEGVSAPAPQCSRPGKTQNLQTQIPRRTGYHFAGWAVDPHAKTADYQAGDLFRAEESLTLYALWEPRIYTLTLLMDDGTLWRTVEVAHGESADLQSLIPMKESDGQYQYTFAGWDYPLPHQIKGNLSRTATFTATPLPAPDEQDNGPLALIMIASSAAGIVALGATWMLVARRMRKKDPK